MKWEDFGAAQLPATRLLPVVDLKDRRQHPEEAFAGGVTRAKREEQLRYARAEERLNKMKETHTKNCYPAIERRDHTFSRTDEPQG